MAVAICPNAETLAAFARGDLPPTELATVADHIGGCGACAGALKHVPEDSLANLARAAAATPPTANTIASPEGSLRSLTSQQVPEGFAGHPRYRILSEIGAGGMGTVYKAEDLLMGRIIAIKVVSPHLTAKASAVERFRKEIRAAARLNHPSVITAHDTGEAGGSHFLVMEFIEGVSLDRLVVKKGPLAVQMACSFTRHAAQGLQHAADKGMVHRDIKPQNLMVTRKGQVKILDFGLARFARVEEAEAVEQASAKMPFGAGKAPAGSGVTNPHMLMGTPDYLSPEQAKNSHEVDARSDIYSLGCTLYFLLTGRAPFATASTLIDKLIAHTKDEPLPLREVRPEVPEGLAEVLAKMMAKNPDDRYQTAAEVASALHPFTRSESTKEPVFEIVEAVPVVPLALPGAPMHKIASQLAFETNPAATGPTLLESTSKPKRAKKAKRLTWWQRRKKLVLGSAVAALFLMAAVAITGRGKKPNPEQPDSNTAKTNAQDKDKTAKEPAGKVAIPPTKINPPGKGVQVLYVLPSKGVFLDDFEPVRDRLVSKGAKVVTAAAEGDYSEVSGKSRPGRAVPIDKQFTADMNLSEYSAVVFCGERSEEYVFANKGSFAAAKVIQRMQQDGKPVAAICVGQGVLAAHGVLRGKRAAESEWTMKKFPVITNANSGIIWVQQGVVTDGKIVTAAGPKDAVAFADAVLKAIDK